MIDPLPALAASFGLAFSGAVMPGPLLSATVKESAARGASAGPLLIAGHVLLELCLVALLLMGASALMASAAFVTAISIAGGAVMLWMAGGMAAGLPKLSLPSLGEGGGPARRGALKLIAAGAAISLSNPYFFVWWASIGMGLLLSSADSGPAAVAAFLAGHALGDALWYSGVSALVAGGRRFLTDLRYRVLVGACAALMAFFGLKFLIEGASRLIGASAV